MLSQHGDDEIPWAHGRFPYTSGIGLRWFKHWMGLRKYSPETPIVH